MNWEEYKEHLKDEWEFQKRNPEILVLTVLTILGNLYVIFFT
jgi:hypothetical protein